MSTDIFVDRTGRRRSVLTWLAVAAAVVLVGSLGLLAAGVLTGTPPPLRGWTERGGVTPGPGTAVIGPAAPTTAPPDQATGQPHATTTDVRPTATPAARPAATAASDRPGQGNGRDNRPTAKPSHPQPKAG